MTHGVEPFDFNQQLKLCLQLPYPPSISTFICKDKLQGYAATLTKVVSANKLIQIVQKWQKFTTLQRKRVSFPQNINYSGSERCCTVSVENKGCFAIYTANQKRFLVPLAYFNNPVFRQLLKMSEVEYGLPSDETIVLPCDSLFMNFDIFLIGQGRSGDLLEALLKLVARSGYNNT